MASSDPEINRNVRQVLTRNWYDLTKTNFASRRGIVRMMGELKKLGREGETRLEPTHLEALDGELRRVRGVQRIHFDLANWRRNEEGEWVPIERTREREEPEQPQQNG
jgi:hypothetical protein